MTGPLDLARWPLRPSRLYTPRAPSRSFQRSGYARTRTNPGGKHFACDIWAPDGTVLVSPVDGRLFVRDGSAGGDEGRMIVVRDRWGFLHAFFHLASVTSAFAPGDPIRAGRSLGRTGRTGNTQGNHLHYEIAHLRRHRSTYWQQRDPRVDPFPFLLAAYRAQRW